MQESEQPPAAPTTGPAAVAAPVSAQAARAVWAMRISWVSLFPGGTVPPFRKGNPEAAIPLRAGGARGRPWCAGPERVPHAGRMF